ncbi:MAG: hypothetical protein FWF90_12815 [Promicromonosporaceae bacterium]|nr:hypothetical protein [Promicromonosporaceae bacterium]
MSLIAPERIGVTSVGAARYLSPGVKMTRCPSHVTSFDEFVLGGTAEGTEIEGCAVAATIAGVTRRGVIEDGRWQVSFESGALDRQVSGVAKISISLRDRWHNEITVTETVVVEEFVDAFIEIDEHFTLRGSLGDPEAELRIAGELELGTHTLGRALIVNLVRDDEAHTVAARGLVTPGWQHGEWRARLPLHGVRPGAYRLEAILTDQACDALTRQTIGNPFHLGQAAT